MGNRVQFHEFDETRLDVSAPPADTRAADVRSHDARKFFIELDVADPQALRWEWGFNDAAERYYRTGHRLMLRGFFDEAAQSFARATRHDPSHHTAYVGWAEALTLDGHSDEANRMLRTASDRYGRNCIIGAARAHVYVHRHDVETATRCADIAVENAPDNAYVWLAAAEVRMAQSNHLAAGKECLSHARSAPETWPNLEVRIALALNEWGRPREAIRTLQAVVAAQPDVPLAWMLLGDAHTALGRHRRARLCFQTALRLAPDLKLHRAAMNWGARLSRGMRRVGELIGDALRF